MKSCSIWELRREKPSGFHGLPAHRFLVLVSGLNFKIGLPEE